MRARPWSGSQGTRDARNWVRRGDVTWDSAIIAGPGSCALRFAPVLATGGVLAPVLGVAGLFFGSGCQENVTSCSPGGACQNLGQLLLGTVRNNILVVDDEPDMVCLLEHQLRTAGYTVCTAANGREGIAQAQRHLPDLILLDVMLPDLDGYSACELLHKFPSTAAIPVLILTAASGEFQRCQAASSGAVGFLNKPFRVSSLLQCVQSTLAQAQAERFEGEPPV